MTISGLYEFCLVLIGLVNLVIQIIETSKKSNRHIVFPNLAVTFPVSRGANRLSVASSFCAYYGAVSK